MGLRCVPESGETFLWGDGRNGRLGMGSVDHELKPRMLKNEAGDPLLCCDVVCGDFHTLALTGAPCLPPISLSV